MKLCECGCGQITTKYRGKYRRFINGHNARGKNNPMYGVHLYGENNGFYGKHHTEETKRKNSESHKGKNNQRYGKIGHWAGKKAENAPMFGKHHTNEAKKKQRTVKIGKYTGKNHPNWQGGVSKLPYGPDWTKERKKEVFEKDEYKCQNSDCWGKCKDDDIMPHHINHDHMNCDLINLITLCRSCNTRANYNKSYWQKLYEEIINSRREPVF